jgi:hypothetical protein
MTSREEELKQLVRDLSTDPYIEKPEEISTDVGGACFLDRHRICGADCTAFTDPHAPTAAERCTLLTGVNAGLELFQELIQLRKQPARPAPPDIRPPDPFGYKIG